MASLKEIAAVEELREGFRQLKMRAAETGDKIAYAVSKAHYDAADRLVVKMGGASVTPDTQSGG